MPPTSVGPPPIVISYFYFIFILLNFLLLFSNNFVHVFNIMIIWYYVSQFICVFERSLSLPSRRDSQSRVYQRGGQVRLVQSLFCLFLCDILWTPRVQQRYIIDTDCQVRLAQSLVVGDGVAVLLRSPVMSAIRSTSYVRKYILW